LRECTYRGELDLETLVWTRGKALPLADLEPACGARDAVIAQRESFMSRRRKLHKGVEVMPALCGVDSGEIIYHSRITEFAR
jgi:hypothetical protein